MEFDITLIQKLINQKNRRIKKFKHVINIPGFTLYIMYYIYSTKIYNIMYIILL